MAQPTGRPAYAVPMILSSGQVAVVTGGASGIGYELVAALAARGLTVVAADIEEAPPRSRRGTVPPGSVVPRTLDVRDADAVRALADSVVAEFGRVDVVCANAGVMTPPAFVWEQSAADWLWTAEVNLFGVANVPALVRAAPRRGRPGARGVHVVDRRAGAVSRWAQRCLHGDEARRRRAVRGAARGARRRRARCRRHRVVSRSGTDPDPRRGAQPARGPRAGTARLAADAGRPSTPAWSGSSPPRWPRGCARRSRPASCTCCRTRARPSMSGPGVARLLADL